MNDPIEQGTISTRSGTWAWVLRTFRPRPNADITGRRLGFKDPANTVNTMSLDLDPEDDEFSEQSVPGLSLAPLRRRFEDGTGVVWIAHPVHTQRAGAGKPVSRVSLHSLDRGSRIVDLPPGRTLGDLKNEELAELVQAASEADVSTGR